MSSRGVDPNAAWKWTAVVSTAALLGVLLLRNPKKRFVYRCGWFPSLFKVRKRTKKCDDLTLADAILQSVERDLLPLTCTGAVLGEGLSGMVVLRPTGEVLSAATTGEMWCSLHSCEMLAIEEAILALKNQVDDATKTDISDCIFVSTHRSSVLDFGLPLLKKCGVTKIYSIFESSDYTSSIEDNDSRMDHIVDEEIAAGIPNGKPPAGVLSRGDYKLAGGIEIIPVLNLIGEIKTKAREFESEEHLKQQMAIDKKKLQLQTRLFTINRVYWRIAKEIQSSFN